MLIDRQIFQPSVYICQNLIIIGEKLAFGNVEIINYHRERLQHKQ